MSRYAGAFDTSNHLTSLPYGGFITYDENGSETQKKTFDSPGGITRSRRYQWDFENRLVLLTKPDNSTVDFKYDPFGRRIKRGTDIFVYDGDNAIGDYGLATDGTINLVGTNLFGPGVDEVIISHSMKVYADALGSARTVQLTGPRTYYESQFYYDDWGKASKYSTAYADYSMLAGDQRFTGRDFDWDSAPYGDPGAGLLYYRARYYDPEIGRFISEDPLQFDSGDENFYRYVGNNPINASDPTGLRVKIQGAHGLDVLSYDVAKAHLTQDPGMARIIHQLESSQTTYTVQIRTGPNEYDPATKTIFWNPHAALRCTAGGTMSPAMGLGHEMAHAAGPRAPYAYDPQYDNKEEKRVITGPERRAARRLREGVRHNHQGTPYIVTTPISR